MEYFKDVGSLGELKLKYRELALANHPDRGGSPEAMRLINAEHDALYEVLRRRQEASGTGGKVEEGPIESRIGFYTENGWAGSRFDSSLSTKEIAERVRAFAKLAYPSWRFSVRSSSHSMVSSLGVSLLRAPMAVFDRLKIEEALSGGQREFEDDQHRKNARYWLEATLRDRIAESFNCWHMEDHLKPYLTDRAYEVLKGVRDYVLSYRYDDSDPSIDYFSTNFYLDMAIGGGKRGLVISPREDIDGLAANIVPQEKA